LPRDAYSEAAVRAEGRKKGRGKERGKRRERQGRAWAEGEIQRAARVASPRLLVLDRTGARATSRSSTQADWPFTRQSALVFYLQFQVGFGSKRDTFLSAIQIVGSDDEQHSALEASSKT
jgi:hypothetical protein